MLEKIVKLLEDAKQDRRLSPFVSRLQATQKKLETAKAGSDDLTSAEAEATALLEEIEKTLGQPLQDAKQAAFNDISKLIGHTPVGSAEGISVGGAATKIVAKTKELPKGQSGPGGQKPPGMTPEEKVFSEKIKKLGAFLTLEANTDSPQSTDQEREALR